MIVGEGYERAALEALRDELGGGGVGAAARPGRHDEECVDLYRRAWVVASSSQREGWGMTLTEAAACGTPAVATAIAGHADAIVDGESGLLVDVDDLPGALQRVLGDEMLRNRLARGALSRARWFTWDATARRALEALAAEAGRTTAEGRGPVAAQLLVTGSGTRSSSASASSASSRSPSDAVVGGIVAVTAASPAGIGRIGCRPQRRRPLCASVASAGRAPSPPSGPVGVVGALPATARTSGPLGRLRRRARSARPGAPARPGGRAAASCAVRRPR